MRSRVLIIPLLAFIFFAVPAFAAEKMTKIGGLETAVWMPSGASSGNWPIIIFSHGFHGCATQSKFLMDSFAKSGYIVFAPNHRDATCASGTSSWRERPEIPFGQPDEWTEDTFRDRGEDIHHLIDALKTDLRFRGKIDWDHLGLIGHSLGGYTVLALGGAWSDWKLPGVRAILALSPYSQPFIVKDTLDDLAAPVMYQGGTRDIGVTPSLRKNEGAYELSPSPKYYVEFMRAGHFAWTNMPSPEHDNIELYSLAFMDHYVLGKPADPVLTEQLRGVSALRYDSDLGQNNYLHDTDKTGILRDK